MNKLKKFLSNNLIIIGLIALVIVGLTAFLIYPNYRQIIAISREIYDQKINLEKNYQRSQEIKELYKNLATIKNGQKNIDGSFVFEGQELEFITALESLAKNNGLRQDINLGTPTPNHQFQKLTIHLEIGGDFVPIAKYLSELEKLNYYISINKINIKPVTATADDPGAIQASLDGEIYWQPIK